MINDLLNYIISAVVAAVASGVTWLIRRVLTNEKQIALLHQEIKARDERRTEDREIMQEIKSDLKEVKRDIIELYKRDPENN